MTTHLTTVWLIALGLLTMSAGIAFADAPRPAKPAPAPSPDLTPGQVVKVVLAVLKDNGPGDAGIRVTFAFASPANQQATGPIERFIPLVKNAAYAPLLNHRSATVREMVVKGDQAEELATVKDRAGATVYYLFHLSKQHDGGPLKDCWMTDGVMRVEPKGQQEA